MKTEKGHRLNQTLAILVIALALAIFFRVFLIGSQSLHGMEIHSIFDATGSIGQIFNQVSLNELHPPLYHYLLHFWMLVFGNSESSTRALSALFGVLLIPSLYFVGKSLFNRRVGLIAALLASFSPFHIYYSQNVRMYSLLPLLSLLSVYLFYKALHSKGIRLWIGWFIATALLIYSDYWGLFIVLAEGCYFLLFWREHRGSLKRVLISGAVLAVLYLPGFYLMAKQASVMSGYGLSDVLPPPRLAALTRIPTMFNFLGPSMILTTAAFATTWITALFFAFALLMSLLSPKMRRERLTFSFEFRDKPLMLTTIYFFIPLLVIFLISQVRPIYQAYNSIIVLPAFLLLGALGISKVGIKPIRWGIILAILALSLVPLHSYYFHYTKGVDREITAYINENAQQNDMLIFTEVTATPFWYYDSFNRPYGSFISFPDDVRPTWYPAEFRNAESDYVKEQIQKLMAKIGETASEEGKIWVVYYPNYEAIEQLIATMEKRFKIEQVVEFPFIQEPLFRFKIYIFSRN